MVLKIQYQSVEEEQLPQKPNPYDQQVRFFYFFFNTLSSFLEIEITTTETLNKTINNFEKYESELNKFSTVTAFLIAAWIYF